MITSTEDSMIVSDLKKALETMPDDATVLVSTPAFPQPGVYIKAQHVVKELCMPVMKRFDGNVPDGQLYIADRDTGTPCIRIIG
jgi:hypothetical protein